MTEATPKSQRARIRRVLKAIPPSLPAGLAALAVLTGRDDAGMPPALKWTFLLLFAALAVTDLITGGVALIHRRRS